jgi:hypothetical protein
MRWIEIGGELAAWDTLETYRERYELEADLAEVDRLKKSIGRRHGQWLSLSNRVAELERSLQDARQRLAAVEKEVAGTRQTGALLIEQVIDRVKCDAGESWSPVPILGFRMWEFHGSGLRGAKMTWPTSQMKATCLNRVPGEDLPHSEGKCGPPACGVYATKEAQSLIDEFTVTARTPAVLGVVALTGKVIEHSRGYRAASASVVALAGWSSAGFFKSDSPNQIDSIFEGRVDFPGDVHTDPVAASQSFLEQWKEDRERWTWEPRFESSK